MQSVNNDDNDEEEAYTDTVATGVASQTRRASASTAAAATAATAVEVPTVDTVGPRDVLMGRGARQTDNPGNARLRQRVADCQAEYARAVCRQTKHWIAVRIVTETQARGGRFLRQVETDPPLYIVVTDVKELSTKIKQLLRDMGPESMERRTERRLYRYRKLGVQQSTTSTAESKERSKSPGTVHSRQRESGPSSFRQDSISSTVGSLREPPVNLLSSLSTPDTGTALEHAISQIRRDHLSTGAAMNFYPSLPRISLGQFPTLHTTHLLSRWSDPYLRSSIQGGSSFPQDRILGYPLQRTINPFLYPPTPAATYLSAFRNVAASSLRSSDMMSPLSAQIQSRATVDFPRFDDGRMHLLENILASRVRNQYLAPPVSTQSPSQAAQSRTVEPSNIEKKFDRSPRRDSKK